MTSPYVMRLDLRVLDHLGIKLYSNAAAVLSEAVANAWDADSFHVSIGISSDRITIEDDGVGMDLEGVNRRFLWVGYDKRLTEGDTSERGRHFMGRKGIGKLALFSIADTIEVHTSRGEEHHAFCMKTEDVRTAITKSQEYHPVPIGFEGPEVGTLLVLKDLKKQRTARSIAALRKRIARRFSVIGWQKGEDGGFTVVVNGDPIGPEDREDLKAIELLWEFGEEERLQKSDCPSLKKRFLISGKVNSEHPDWLVRGWLGAASKPKKLKHDEAGYLNGIVVLARGRLIQENILDKLSFSRILVSYLTGQVEAEFLDLPGEDDIATSDRQRIVEDDERYLALTSFLRESLVSISDQWTNLRNEMRGREAVSEHPALEAWIESLPPAQRGAAQRLLGLVSGVELESEEERMSLYRSGVIAFERLRLTEQSHRLVESGELRAEDLLPLLSDLAILEGSLYRDIVKSRLDVIKRFEDLVDENEKEKVLQEHLFENLWLLDPGWERATGSERIEQSLKKDYPDFAEDLTDKESKGRVDIRYRTNAGQHMVVELKRAKRRMHLHELIEQGNRYRTALHKCLEMSGSRSPHISIVFVVGQLLYETEGPGGFDVVEKALSALNARVVQYEQLIGSARTAYSEYLERSRSADRLENILREL